MRNVEWIRSSWSTPQKLGTWSSGLQCLCGLRKKSFRISNLLAGRAATPPHKAAGGDLGSCTTWTTSSCMLRHGTLAKTAHLGRHAKQRRSRSLGRHRKQRGSGKDSWQTQRKCWLGCLATKPAYGISWIPDEPSATLLWQILYGLWLLASAGKPCQKLLQNLKKPNG